MILYYSIAKEGKYKKDEDGNYVDCAVAIAKGYISHVENEEERIKEANNMKAWVCSQIEMPQIHVKAITKEQFERIK